MKKTFTLAPTLASIAIILIASGSSHTASAAPLELQWTLESHRVAPNAQEIQRLGAPLPPISLVLDDGAPEGDFGVNGVTATQFVWFNRLSPPETMFLEEIHVLFPVATATMGPGDAIDLVVYRDPDGDPTNGAELLAVFAETIQFADGVNFSIYPVILDEVLFPSTEIYLGVIPRFIESGVTAPTSPAALDSTAPQGRSWIATWQGDPPTSPELPSDGLVLNIDDLSPGNWVLRGFGSPAPVTDIPTASPVGLAITALLLMGFAVGLLRRRPEVIELPKRS